MSRARFLLVFFASFLASAPASACLWSYGTDLRGEQVSLDTLDGAEIVKSLQRYEPRKFWQKKKDQHKPNGNYQYRNDYAVILLHLGEVKPAIDILLEIEREQPGQYETAANLGTAYELAGDNRKALEWIRNSIARNPEAHNGTEWLHVRILDAKLAMEADPGWLLRHSILGSDFGERPIPKHAAPLPPGNRGKALNVDDLKRAIGYQLGERYQFVKAPDPVVGSLLFDWGNILFRTETLESAAAFYREAIRFGAPRIALAKQRLARAEQIIRENAPKK